LTKRSECTLCWLCILPSPDGTTRQNEQSIQLFAQAGSTFSQIEPTQHTMTIGAIMLQPKSREMATIQDDDPSKVTLSDQGYLTDETDLTTFVNTYRIYKQIAEQLAAFGSSYQLLMPTMNIINENE